MTENKSIHFYSDFNCPFCYALNERMIILGDPVSIQWRGIEHMPGASSQNDSWEEQSMIVNEVSVIRKRAPEIPFTTPSFRPSTRAANLLVAHLGQTDPRRLSKLRTLIYRAYWMDNRDISDLKVLEDLSKECGLAMPEKLDDHKTMLLLSEWQKEWEGERFQTRLPILFDPDENRPILGFPTYELLNGFIAGESFPFTPETFAACELRPKQVVLVIAPIDPERCNPKELVSAYEITHHTDLQSADNWLEKQPCPPDVIITDTGTFGDLALEHIRKTKRQEKFRKTAIIALLNEMDGEAELAAFDSGASDVVFDLSNPKVCQARVEFHMRMQRSNSLLGLLAQIDYLTEVPNKREFERRLEREWFRARRSKLALSLLLVDIDYFKPYNDTYGHTQGDDCLRQVAQEMQKVLHRPSDMIARIGGEEFAVLLPETPIEGAEKIAEQMRKAVHDLELPHKASSVSSNVTVSIGVGSISPDNKQPPQKIINRADRALYDAKRRGRNRYVLRTGKN
jgi:diguanylate cyclase (GGDEF)-like protein